MHEIELWNTGPEWDIDSTPALGARRARDYAVRFYLAGLYARHYGVRISSCGRGLRMGLPPDMYSCRFQRDGRDGGNGQLFTVRWSARGRAEVPLDEDAYRVRHMDGSTVRARPGGRIRIGEEPVLIEHRTE
ncbi:hypothetical protein [Streptomyces sp. UG1]|uniref:hypothetical protein n=1 Tax=Streptomyces sp. UG1 TaxID=3417652 RepID=UPI003CE6860D